MHQKEVAWKQWYTYIKNNKRFVLIGILLLIMEYMLAPVLSNIIPDTWYFKNYLPLQSLWKTQQFLNSQYYVELDAQRGWHNRANSSYSKIRYDCFGSRSNRGINKDRQKKLRVVFLGDSRIGGYINVGNNQTINAFLENDEIETLNLATDLYGLDQTYLAMQDAIHRFQPDIIVIGISTDVGNLLDCHYLPFMYPEIGLPLLKPRYILRDNGLVLQTPPYREFLQNLPHNPTFLNYLKHNEAHYARFMRFQLRESTPFLGFLSLCERKYDLLITNIGKMLGHYKSSPVKNRALVSALIKQTKILAEKNNIEMIYLLLPTRAHVKGYRQRSYNDLATILRANSVHFVDVLSLFRQYSNAKDLLYDDVHNTKSANQIVAKALKRVIKQFAEDENTVLCGS